MDCVRRIASDMSAVVTG